MAARNACAPVKRRAETAVTLMQMQRLISARAVSVLPKPTSSRPRTLYCKALQRP